MLSVEEFRSFMHKMNVDAFMLRTKDEYLSEYSEGLKQLCGFTGSNGLLIITKNNKCPFFTDGRYITQAHSQLDQDIFQIYNTQEKDPCEWVKENSTSISTLGYYSQYFTIKDIRKYESICKLAPFLIEKMNNHQKQEIVLYSIEYSGENSKDKCERVAKTMEGISEAALLTDPDSISWLLNLRNENAQYTPHVLSRAILYKNGNVDLFIQNKEDSILKNSLDDHINAFDIGELESALHKLNLVMIDPSTTPMNIMNAIENKKIVEKEDPCLLIKAIKNQTEIAGTVNAHIKDGIAVINFLHWLENNISNGITELDAEQKILDYRKEQNLFKRLSFPTISAFNENSAIIHYRANKYTNKVIKGRGLYLIDSGGQYLDGITDITRTVAIGIPTNEQMTNYTIVLKAHIAIASAVFPSGTTGGELDILARAHLWRFRMDYMHGTGHGVGNYLSVHEGPQAISKGNKIELMSRMILSNEPGYYIPNKYGIRIENLMYVDKQENRPISKPICGEKFLEEVHASTTEYLDVFEEHSSTSTTKLPLEIEFQKRYNDFLSFKQLTCIPYDRRLINVQMLTQGEIKWINNYHQF
ncbi:MAG: M24 family metallopeptidase, partial [Wolbachia sp.]|nr:M24 family metallopeptidase [Wolbachia sp.]